MAGPNNHEQESWIEANDNYTPNDANKHSKLIRGYISQKLNNKSDRLRFAKKIDKSQTIWPDVISEIEQYRASKQEFTGLEVNADTIKLLDMKRELGGFLSSIQSKKTSLRATLLQEYDISSTDYTKNISSKVDAIESEQELEELLSTDTSRDEFLQKTYKKNPPRRRLITNILQDFGIEEKLDQIEPHLKREFEDTLEKFKRREKLEIADIMVLFETNILSKTQRQRIIETFMPSISLSEAIKLKVIDDKMVRQVKKQALESSLDTGMFSSVNLDGYIDNINNDELIVSTQWLFASQKSQDRLFEENFFFEKFQSDFNEMLKKIEEDLAAKSIQTPWEMREILSWVNNVKWIENFKEWSTLVIKQQQKDNSGESHEVVAFAEIISLASAGTFVIQERWVSEYNPSSTQNSRQTYSQFIDFATKWDIPESIEVLTPDALRHKIETEEIKDVNGNGRFFDRSEISDEIQDIDKQIEARKSELKKNKTPKSQWDNDEQLQDLYKLRDEKNIIRDNAEERNKQTLASEINKLDIAGKKFGMEKWTSFVTKWWNGDVFTVLDIDEINQVVTVKGLLDNEPISYTQFVENFESQKAKRVSKIDAFEELFSQTDDVYKSWQGFELKDNKIRNKSSKQKIDYDYLVPDKESSNQELIKIHTIDGTMATISFWEAKSNNGKWKDDKKSQQDVFSVAANKYTVSIGVLDHYIREQWLSLRSLEEWKIAEEQMKGIPKPEDKFGFANWFFQWMSVAAAIKGGKTGIEQITNILNEWDDNKANQFAMKMFWPILWADGRTDLQSRVEQTQKKNMDEAIERLKWINSFPATKLIESWLLDPRTPEYKKEAGMFFMFEKYGALCAKWPLYPYQGKYFWYQKMGWKIGDSNWVEIHAQNDRDPKQNTTEEQLVYSLMKKQTSTEGYNGVKRRSKLDKELKAKRGEGKESEYDTGLKDGGNERSLQDRLDGGLSEMSSGNYPNAFGWLETVVGKGGSMKDMNMIPFVMTFSWMAYNFEKDILDKVKNFPWESRMLMMLRMMSYKPDMDLLNNTIMEICKNLQKDPKYAGILPKAQKIFDNQHNKSMEEGKKQAATIEFYKEYGEVLTNTMYMLNTGNVDDVHNKMIFFEKDTNSTFNAYYNLMEGYINADGDFGKDEGLMADSFAWAGTWWLDLYRATKQMLELRTWWAWAKHESGPIMWKEIVHEFEVIPKRQYSPDPVKNKAMQEKLLEMNLRKFLAAIVSLNTDTRVLSSYNAPTWYFNKLNDWWVYFDELINAGANGDSIKSGGNSDIIDRFVSNIMNVEQKGANYKKPTRGDGKGGFEYIKEWDSQGQTLTVSDLIQGKAQNIIDTPTVANDNIQEQYDDLDEAA